MGLKHMSNNVAKATARINPILGKVEERYSMGSKGTLESESLRILKNENEKLGTRNFINKDPQFRNVSSFGNIYKPSKLMSLGAESPRLKEVRGNEIVTRVKGEVGDIVGSNNHVLGFGGGSYGHGSIINRVKNTETFISNSEGNRNTIIFEKQKTVSNFDNTEELKNAGNEEYRRGHFREAISLYNKAIALSPRSAACHNNKAAALAGLGRFAEAVGECMEAINCDPSYSRAHNRLGNLYSRLGRVEDAKWHFKLSGHDLGSEAVLRLLHLEKHLMSMKLAHKLEDWDCVLKESTLAIKAGADASDQVVAIKAEALLKLNRAEEALELLMAAMHSEERRSQIASTGDSCLLIVETQVHLYLGRFEAGVAAAEQAVNLDSNPKSLMWLRKARGAAHARKTGTQFFKAGMYLEACSAYDHGLEFVPWSSVLLCNRAACRSKLCQWDMAIGDCNAALRNRPGYAKALSRRAHCNAKLGKWEESLRDYSTLSKEKPGDDSIASSLIQVQMELKRAQSMGSYNIHLRQVCPV